MITGLALSKFVGTSVTHDKGGWEFSLEYETWEGYIVTFGKRYMKSKQEAKDRAESLRIDLNAKIVYKIS